MKKDKVGQKQEALAWRKRPDVVPAAEKTVVPVKVSESQYLELLDFSVNSVIYVSYEIKYHIYKSGCRQLVLVCSDPEEKGTFSLQAGILADVCKQSNPSAYSVQAREIILFNLYRKHKNLLIVQAFKYREEKLNEASILLLEECVNLTLSYLSKINMDNMEKYLALLNKLIYLENFEPDSEDSDNKFKLKLFLLLSVLEAREVNVIFHCSSNRAKLRRLKLTLARKLKTISTREIRHLTEAPENYLPCIAADNYDFGKYISLTERSSRQRMGDFQEIAQKVFCVTRQKNLDVILLDSQDMGLKKLGIKATVSSILNSSLSIKWNLRVRITDLVLVNRIIYAKTEPADNKLTKKQLIQALEESKELIPIYNKNVKYSIDKVAEYNPEECSINESRFLHNSSYKMMWELGLPLLPIMPLPERFELIKKEMESRLLQKIEALYEEYIESVKEKDWETGLEKSTALVSCDPENSDYYGYKARCLKRLERYQEAIENYELGLTRYEKKGKGKALPSGFYFAKGACWFYLGNHKEATEAFDKVNKTDLCKFHAEVFEEYRKKIADKIENNNVENNNVENGNVENNNENFDPENIGLSIEKLPLPDNIRDYAKKLHLSYENAESDRYKNEYLHHLVSLLTLPWGKKNKLEASLKAVRQNLEKSHFGLNGVKNRILESLVFSLRGGSTKPPILLLVGPPGVGKTSIANALAEALGRKCARLPLGGMHDTSVIKGFFRAWGGSESGKIISLIRQTGTWNPVMILDEIDKINQGIEKAGVEGALLALLDPEQNSQFSDDYFDATFDLSEVFFIATANSIDDISFPLLNRMEVIHLSGYTDIEKLEIAKRYLIPKILEEAKVSNEEIKITDAVIKDVIASYTREAGVRELERLLRSLVQKYLLDQAIAEGRSKDLNIDKKLLKEYFRNKRISGEIYGRIPSVGSATGLACNSMGGSTINIEAMTIPGSGKIKATGKLGYVLKESIEVAYARAIADLEEQKIQIPDISKKDIHVHLLEGAIPKEGPSAGIAIYASLVSLLSGNKVRQDVAMTGEIGLYGEVLAIGGLKEKLGAAVRHRIKTVVIPKANRKDLMDMPEELKSRLEIKAISKASELLEIIFDRN